MGVNGLKINDNQNIGNQAILSEQPLELSKGEIYMATVKEKISNKEAVLQIKGKDVQVEFEGRIPKGKRIAIQVKNSEGEHLKVNTVAETPKGQQNEFDVSKILRNMGVTPTPELKQATKTLMDQGTPLTRETIQDLRMFLEKTPGTSEQKLDTLQAVGNKKLEVTLNHLRAVHEALHGQSLNEVFDRLQKEMALPSHESGNSLVEIVRQVNAAILNRSPIDNVLEQLSEKVVNDPHIARETAINLEQAIQEVVQLMQASGEEAAYEKLTKVLEQAEADMRQKDLSESMEIEKNITREESQTSHISATKQILITETTQRLSEATHQFRDVKREITRHLDGIIRTTQNIRANIFPQAKESLEKAIDLLDRAILKSDITLFTDMKTEKKLLVASSQLTEAKKLLENGENAQAAKLFNEVKTSLEKLNWQPSKTKVMHYLTKQQFYKDDSSGMHKMASQLHTTTQAFQKQEPSARNMFEWMRSMGLNHDSEAAQSLSVDQKGVTSEELNQNMKALVMKLTSGIEGKSAHSVVNEQLEQVLNNLTGQQLLSKLDTGSATQNMFFNLPLDMGNRVENVKLYINARKENEKIDWQNCSLYFLIDTKKMGETGILVSAAERNLSITLKNDGSDFKSKAESLVSKCQQKLEEIGYRSTGIQFAKLNQENNSALHKALNEPVAVQTKAMMKGFDFKI